MSLCNYCKHTLDCRPPDSYVRHHKRIKDLEVSSYNCQLCKLILSGLNMIVEPFQSNGTNTEEYRYISLVSRCNRGGGGIRRRIMFSAKLWTGTVMRNVYSLTSEDCCRILENPVWSLSRPVRFEDSLTTVGKWFKLCNFEHGKCFRTSSIMPTRVIDIAPRDGSNDVRLYHPPKGYNFPYVALSHCWGPSSTPSSSKTMRSNILNFERRIQVSTLARSFQDAVHVARQLNIRYLWIDSLCIIQDDPDDWERESAQMLSIYQNAYLTIAATASASSEDSMLTARPPANIFQLDGKDGTSEIIHARLHPVGSRSLSDSPLFKRAWAFQEMVLSPRVLHFAEEQLYWKCRNDVFSEDGLVRLMSPLQHNFQSGKFVSQDKYGGWKLWWDWVQIYSALQLSDTKDKAAALAGLTSLYLKSRGDGDQPLAGLWRNDIHFGLLWYSLGPKRFTNLDNAPSWSWFKMNAPVMSHFTVNGMWKRNVRRTANILEAGVHWLGPQLTSPLAGGAVSMESRIRPINVQHLESTEQNLTRLVQAGSVWTSTVDQIQKSLWNSRGPLFTMEPVAEAFGIGAETCTLHSVGYFSFDKDMPARIPNALCLEIVASHNPLGQQVEPGTRMWMFRHEVLIVEPVKGIPDVYCRLGVGHILVGLDCFAQPTNEVMKSAWDFFHNARPCGITLI